MYALPLFWIIDCPAAVYWIANILPPPLIGPGGWW